MVITDRMSHHLATDIADNSPQGPPAPWPAAVGGGATCRNEDADLVVMLEGSHGQAGRFGGQFPDAPVVRLHNGNGMT